MLLNKMITFIFTSSLIVVGLTGCSGSTPKCSDTETKDLVIQITKDEFKNRGMGELLSQLKLEIEAIRTTKHNKDVDSYECAANLKMSGNGKTKSAPITYTVESTDKGDQFYVNVYGL